MISFGSSLDLFVSCLILVTNVLTTFRMDAVDS